MRRDLLVGVAGLVLGGALTAVALLGSGAMPASSGEIAELRDEVARLGGAIARTERLAMVRASAASAGRVLDHGHSPDGPGACASDAIAQDAAASSDEAARVDSSERAYDPDAARDALALVESAEVTGVWRSEDVLALQEQLLDLPPEEQIAVTESLVIALNEGRLRLPPGVISAF